MPTLTPMTSSEYDVFLARVIPEFAAVNIRAGYWDESEALEKSRKQTEALLPQGLQTRAHYLYTLYDGDDAVGMIWLKANVGSSIQSGFIYDVFIEEKFRGKGYGKQAMLLIEEKARELGLKSISLHVFAYNTVAKNLYESIGYEISSLNMTKQL